MKLKDRISARIPEEKRRPIRKALRAARVVKNIICWTMIVILSFAVITFLLTRFSGGTPSVFGYTIQRITSGSMEPALMVGDVILSKKVEDVESLAKGDIITFKGGAQFGNGINVTHRVVVAPHEEDGGIVLQTQGDANDIADDEITADYVESKYICKLGFVTKLYELFLSPWGLLIFIGLLLFIFFDELLNIVRIVSGNYPEEKEESIAEIMERIQREDREKAEEKKRRALKNTQDMVSIMAESGSEKAVPSEEAPEAASEDEPEDEAGDEEDDSEADDESGVFELTEETDNYTAVLCFDAGIPFPEGSTFTVSLLTEEEEARLSARVLKGDERALNKLIEANLRFVVVIARQYQGKGLSMEDLVSEGNMGLMKAATKFDATRGLRFVNYAVVFIRRQIEKALDKESAEQRVESTCDGQTRSVDAPLGSKANVSLLSVLVNSDSPMADQRVYDANLAEAIEQALEDLNDREKAVIVSYYGIGTERMTMSEIGEQMGLKRERVRQIRDRATRRMRKNSD